MPNQVPGGFARFHILLSTNMAETAVHLRIAIQTVFFITLFQMTHRGNFAKNNKFRALT